MNKSEKMFAIVSGFDESGLDRARYCAQHEISVSTFAYWRSKWLRRCQASQAAPSTSVGKFVGIEPLPRGSGLASGCELVYPNGLRLQFTHIDIKTLTSLVQSYV